MAATTAPPDVSAPFIPRPVHPWLRWLWIAATVLSFGAGFTLSLLTEDTDEFFAWTIASPITAATLGAGFWFGTTLVALSLRERVWAYARVAGPGVLVFTVGMLAATLIHLDLFHTDSATGIIWTAVYIAIPPALAVALYLQLQLKGIDPRPHPMPAWLRLLLAAPAVVLVPVGIGMFIAPTTFDGLWPWPLTPLAARAIGTGMVSLGTIVGQMAWEDDLRRDRNGFAALVVLGVLMLVVVLLRYSDMVDWDKLQAWGMLAGIIGAVGIGAVGLWLERRAAAV